MEMNGIVRGWLKRVAGWLKGLGVRTGLWILGVCAVCYVLSFAQMALPIPIAWKGALWVALFGMAKATQYAALLILGKEGIRRVKGYFRRQADLEV